MVGKRLNNFVHPDDQAETADVAELVRRGEPLRHFVNRYRRKDGRIAHVMWSARWSETRQLRLAVARDVTAFERAALAIKRKQTDERLQALASRLTAVSPEDGHDRESLFRHADSGMYSIKREQQR